MGLGVPGLFSGFWRSRGYLPHFETRDKMQSITFRLADSLPQSKLAEMKREMALLPEDQQSLERRKQIDQWLDAGMGCCALRHPTVAQVVQDTLLRFDGERYKLLAWCVMPNHVHVLIHPAANLGKVVQSWKSYTGRWALAHNDELGLGVHGKSFWMREYWDRYIRDKKHYEAVVDYIHNNPVKTGLCKAAQHWRWSSKWRKA
ncbi:MAG: transposase [Verrucomicrobia bacterium]|nr:transposase [Verrucomicrobiota bacterium]